VSQITCSAPGCDRFLPPYRGVGRPRRYCSQACRGKAGVPQARARWNVQPRACRRCGAEFVPVQGGQRYCPDHRPTHERHDMAPKVCAKCGQSFVPNNGRQLYCLSPCGARVRGRVVGPRIRPCVDCGHLIDRQRNFTRCVECSLDHTQDVWQNATHLRRVAYANGDEGITLAALLEIAGSNCQLCGRAVRRKAEIRADKATLDHVVPITRGGTHTWDNVRVLCAPCNGKSWRAKRRK
jgi:5-methylcytosine-specific restriction endonuclease McrA